MISYFGMMLLRRLPTFLVVLAGVIFSIVRWKRHPRVSLMTMIALALYLIEFIVYATVLYWMPSLRETLHISLDSFKNLYVLLYVLDDFAYAAVIILLVAAAMTGRRRAIVTNH